MSIGYLITLLMGMFITKRVGLRITFGLFGLLGVITKIAFVYFTTPVLRMPTYFYNNLWGVIIAAVIIGISLAFADEADEINIPGKVTIGLAVISGVLIIGVFSVSWINSHRNISKEYSTIQVKEISQSEELKSTKETPIAISTVSAKNKVAKMMSVVPNSNAYELSTITAQVLNGEYVYIVAIDFKGFWEWKRLGEIPGYFVMSATDINAQPKFVEKTMKYTESAYLDKDAKRNMYLNSKGSFLRGNVNLEIDDEGNPFYIQTLMDYKGFSKLANFSKFKVSVINAVTGEVKVYDIKDAPEFINAPITSGIASTLNEYFGKFKHGYWNTHFGKKDIKVPTSNGVYYGGAVTPVLDKNNNLFYFTDFTSANSGQDSALGYSLVNARTGEIEFYEDKQGMMDSDGAISVSGNLYPEKKWDARMPILYNVDGVPTWIISLLDGNGIFKKYVYISALDSDIVVDGDSAQSTLESYRIRLTSKGSNNKDTDKAEAKEISGVVERVQFIPSSGSSLLAVFILKDVDTVFSVSSNNAIYSSFIKEGDQVKFTANLFEGEKSATIDNIEIHGVSPVIEK